MTKDEAGVVLPAGNTTPASSFGILFLCTLLFLASLNKGENE